MRCGSACTCCAANAGKVVCRCTAEARYTTHRRQRVPCEGKCLQGTKALQWTSVLIPLQVQPLPDQHQSSPASTLFQETPHTPHPHYTHNSHVHTHPNNQGRSPQTITLASKRIPQVHVSCAHSLASVLLGAHRHLRLCMPPALS